MAWTMLLPIDTTVETTVGAERPLRMQHEGKENRSLSGSRIKGWVVAGFAVAGMAFFLRTFVLQGFMIRSNSMSDTLLEGDIIVVDRAALGTYLPFLGLRTPGYSSPRRFDILVFDLPSGRGKKTTFAKRLVGMPERISPSNA